MYKEYIVKNNVRIAENIVLCFLIPLIDNDLFPNIRNFTQYCSATKKGVLLKNFNLPLFIA